MWKPKLIQYDGSLDLQQVNILVAAKSLVDNAIRERPVHNEYIRTWTANILNYSPVKLKWKMDDVPSLY